VWEIGLIGELANVIRIFKQEHMLFQFQVRMVELFALLPMVPRKHKIAQPHALSIVLEFGVLGLLVIVRLQLKHDRLQLRPPLNMEE